VSLPVGIPIVVAGALAADVCLSSATEKLREQPQVPVRLR
jgi:hypothetical protein